MLGAAKKSINEIGERLKKQALFMASIVGFLWVIEIVDSLAPFDFESLGIRPRQFLGLVGILFAPFLHDGVGHLAGNSIGLFFFGWIILLGGTQSFLRVTALIAVIAGMGTWLFGASRSIHIGASGIVFGYMAFLLLRGFFEKSLRWVMVALIVAFVIYGFVDLGFNSTAENNNGAVNISWSGHLSGFAGGIIAAWIFYYRPRNSPYAQTQITRKPAPSPVVSAILAWFSKRH
ncbi:MAG: rhomboid family intramembrane serine protease [Verrucomicrobiae bacterium]|nr:rhomboid family intramembrane serine protease [Verrucomicrobiae bacterium]